ncbi:MAG: glycosyltransferase family 39 protein [Thermoplasmatales archaeon]|nr:glycosyltransferase family 39 protein [Thermoplasmatales archaeon]
MIKMKKIDALWLACAFVLVLFLNAYFNFSSDVAINREANLLEEKYYLSGPDPYYNMRLLEKTLEEGKYPYMGGKHGDLDPLLNYPLGGSGSRPPLFTMLTIGLGKIFSLFINESDAMGYAMQLVPAIYGALLVIPVYFLGKIVFNRKVGLIASLFVALIPIHLASGHGSAYSLYDHDSFVLLFTTSSLVFLIMALKEENKKASFLLASLSGMCVAGITMTWVSAEYIYALIAVYGVIQMLIDIVTKKIEEKVPVAILTSMLFGYVLSFPITWVKSGFTSIYLTIIIAVGIFSLIYIYIGKKNIPWIISIPSIFGLGIFALIFLYLIRNTTNAFLKLFTPISEIIFGKAIYGGKVSLTIAEAFPFDIGRTIMSFGPVFYLIACFGFVFFLYQFYKRKFYREYFAVFVWLGIEIWLASTAGRFLNDLVPLIAVFGAYGLWIIISKIDFSGMIKKIKEAGGGFQAMKKGVKIRHVAGAIFIALFVIFPNTWLAFDASLPSNIKHEYQTKTNKLGAYGLGFNTEEYWVDAFSWLKRENTNLNESERPGFISWWDYGFYCVAIAKNPTVADNFQEGIPPAANMHTSRSEREAVGVFIIRLAEGDVKEKGGVTGELRDIFNKYLGDMSDDLEKILEGKYENTSAGKIVGESYGGKNYIVREENAIYHDGVKVLTLLDDENITMLYREIQNYTGKSIRYYGVEGYDVNIFNVFTFLADKGVFGYETAEDDYYKLYYRSSKTGQSFTPDELRNITKGLTQDEIREIYGKFDTYTEKKQGFYESMVYRTYLGVTLSKEIFEGAESYGYWYLIPFWTDNATNPFGEGNYSYNPTIYMKHFVIKYISPVNTTTSKLFLRGELCLGMPAVVIAKYYEGARIEGRLLSDGEPLEGVKVVVRDDFSQLLQMRYGNQILNRTLEKIPHDISFTDKEGKFSVIAPAGNITISFYSNETLIKELKFDGTDFPPISEEEATRVVHWIRDVGAINIEKGGIKGIIYWDKNGNGEYDGNDEKLQAKIVFDGKEIHASEYDFQKLLPISYRINVSKDGYETRVIDVNVMPNSTIWHNISLIPSKVNVSGVVWYDENNNGLREENEVMQGVTIQFNVIEKLDDYSVNESARSNSTGYYVVRLYPAKYKVEVNYSRVIENETIYYRYEGIVDVKIGDSPKTIDIKLRRE